MVKLIAKSPCDGVLPLEINGLILTEVVPGAITSVAPYAGQEAATSDALKALIGAGMPAPNRATGREGARVIWTGAGQAMVTGARVDPSLAQHAALTDQSDAWVMFHLQGQGVEDVLARLTPLDLNPGVFKKGHAARSLLGHMNAVFLKVAADTFEIMVFRSMARTAVHEFEVSMKAVAARAALAGNTAGSNPET